MGIKLDDTNSVNNESLMMNLIGAKAIANSIFDIESNEHLQRVIRSAFNRMAECLDDEKVSFLDAMKFNLLGVLLESEFNLEKAAKLAQANVKFLETELEKRNAPPPAD